MATKVLVPRLGEGVDEVTVTKWLKQVGDSIRELEPLLEVNTDKVDTEIPSPASGVILKIEMQEGQAAKVGELLAIIGTVGEKIDNGQVSIESSKSAQKTPFPAVIQAQQPTPHSQQSNANKDLGFISPIVARIAAEHGVDLSQVRGGGLNGRITKNDVLMFIGNKGADIVTSEKSANQQPFDKLRATPAAFKPMEGDQLIKHTMMRKSIAQHMVESRRTAPHVLTVMEADMSRVVRHRAMNKPAFEQNGVNLTYTTYFMAAIATGLKAHPQVNSSWSDEGVLLHKNINIGMAASLGEEGLIVPVIKGANNLSLLEMARTVNDLARRARNKTLQPDEVKGGTFTLTNHGIGGSLFAFPIINQPQCGILGIGAMQKRVVVIPADDGAHDDTIAIRPMVYMSLVFDHRILDGASADGFLVKVKETLENWAE